MEHENIKDDTIEIKIPSAKKATENLRKNPWIAISIILGAFVLLMLFGKGSSAPGSIDKNAAANSLVGFLNQNSNGTVTLESVSADGNLYKVYVNYKGNSIPVYVTTDGKYFIQSVIPISGTAAAETATGNPSAINFSDFTSNPALYPSIGSDSAKATVIEFADFQCPWCGLAAGLASWSTQNTGAAAQMKSQSGDLAGMAGKIEQLAQQGKIKFIYVPMNFLGQGSTYATEAAFCANEQEKFWQMHDAIFTNQVSPEQEGAQFTKTQLETIAKGISGLDSAKFNNCLETGKYSSQAKQVAQKTSGIGTPTFVVNGQKVQSSWTAVQNAIGGY